VTAVAFSEFRPSRFTQAGGGGLLTHNSYATRRGHDQRQSTRLGVRTASFSPFALGAAPWCPSHQRCKSRLDVANAQVRAQPRRQLGLCCAAPIGSFRQGSRWMRNFVARPADRRIIVGMSRLYALCVIENMRDSLGEPGLPANQKVLGHAPLWLVGVPVVKLGSANLAWAIRAASASGLSRASVTVSKSP
jgi:hypothetical protein